MCHKVVGEAMGAIQTRAVVIKSVSFVGPIPKEEGSVTVTAGIAQCEIVVLYVPQIDS